MTLAVHNHIKICRSDGTDIFTDTKKRTFERCRKDLEKEHSLVGGGGDHDVLRFVQIVLRNAFTVLLISILI